MLELSRITQALFLPVKFIGFTLEERPAYHTSKMGSSMYVKKCLQTNEKIKGSVILEMVGFTANNQFYPFPFNFFKLPKNGDYLGVVGNFRSRNFGKVIVEGIREGSNLPVASFFIPGNGKILPVTRKSDHASFWDGNYCSIMLTDTAFARNPNYHKSSDTEDTLDYEFMYQLVLGLKHSLLQLT